MFKLFIGSVTLLTFITTTARGESSGGFNSGGSTGSFTTSSSGGSTGGFSTSSSGGSSGGSSGYGSSGGSSSSGNGGSSSGGSTGCNPNPKSFPASTAPYSNPASEGWTFVAYETASGTYAGFINPNIQSNGQPNPTAYLELVDTNPASFLTTALGPKDSSGLQPLAVVSRSRNNAGDGGADNEFYYHPDLLQGWLVQPLIKNVGCIPTDPCGHFPSLIQSRGLASIAFDHNRNLDALVSTDAGLIRVQVDSNNNPLPSCNLASESMTITPPSLSFVDTPPPSSLTIPKAQVTTSSIAYFDVPNDSQSPTHSDGDFLGIDCLVKGGTLIDCFDGFSEQPANDSSDSTVVTGTPSSLQVARITPWAMGQPGYVSYMTTNIRGTTGYACSPDGTVQQVEAVVYNAFMTGLGGSAGFTNTVGAYVLLPKDPPPHQAVSYAGAITPQGYNNAWTYFYPQGFQPTIDGPVLRYEIAGDDIVADKADTDHIGVFNIVSQNHKTGAFLFTTNVPAPDPNNPVPRCLFPNPHWRSVLLKFIPSAATFFRIAMAPLRAPSGLDYVFFTYLYNGNVYFGAVDPGAQNSDIRNTQPMQVPGVTGPVTLLSNPQVFGYAYKDSN